MTNDETKIVDNGKFIEISFTLDREISAAQYDAKAASALINDTATDPAVKQVVLSGRSLLHHMIEREHKLRTAIRDAGFAVLEASNRWDIVDVTEKAKRQEENEMRMITAEIEKNRENYRTNLELAEAIVKLAKAAKGSNMLIHSAITMSHSLVVSEVRGECQAASAILETVLQDLQPILDKHTPAKDE